MVARGQAEPGTEVSSVSAWKKKPQLTTLPSGNKVIIRRVTLRSFLVNGMVPNSLMSIVQESVDGKAPDVDVQAIMSDPDQFNELIAMMDTVTIQCVVEPEVHPAPESEADRRDDLLYVDEIDETDKTYIFNLATGTVGELEPFRAEPSAGVGAVPRGSGVVDKPKRPARSRR